MPQTPDTVSGLRPVPRSMCLPAKPSGAAAACLLTAFRTGFAPAAGAPQAEARWQKREEEAEAAERARVLLGSSGDQLSRVWPNVFPRPLSPGVSRANPCLPRPPPAGPARQAAAQAEQAETLGGNPCLFPRSPWGVVAGRKGEGADRGRGARVPATPAANAKYTDSASHSLPTLGTLASDVPGGGGEHRSGLVDGPV